MNLADFEGCRFTQTQIAAATGVQRNRLAMWLKRGHLRYAEQDGDEIGKAGLAHKLCARTALRIAIIDALSGFLDPSEAGSAVSVFMDSGSGVVEGGQPTRDPACLFDCGQTILVVFEDGSALVHCLEPGSLAADLPGLRQRRRVLMVPMIGLHQGVLLGLASELEKVER